MAPASRLTASACGSNMAAAVKRQHARMCLGASWAPRPQLPDSCCPAAPGGPRCPARGGSWLPARLRLEARRRIVAVARVLAVIHAHHRGLLQRRRAPPGGAGWKLDLAGRQGQHQAGAGEGAAHHGAADRPQAWGSRSEPSQERSAAAPPPQALGTPVQAQLGRAEAREQMQEAQKPSVQLLGSSPPCWASCWGARHVIQALVVAHTRRHWEWSDGCRSRAQVGVQRKMVGPGNAASHQEVEILFQTRSIAEVREVSSGLWASLDHPRSRSAQPRKQRRPGEGRAAPGL